jgi:hypothetical protein
MLDLLRDHRAGYSRKPRSSAARKVVGCGARLILENSTVCHVDELVCFVFCPGRLVCGLAFCGGVVGGSAGSVDDDSGDVLLSGFVHWLGLAL